MLVSDESKVARYFASLTSRYKGSPDIHSLCVTHLVANTPPFVDALSEMTTVASLVAKPKSVAADIAHHLGQKFQVEKPGRDFLADSDQALAFLERRAAGKKVVLLDVGGYFAPALSKLHADFSGDLLGVVEDTENGLQRYEKLGAIPVPVYSVARSPIKNAEDYLVGVAIVFSTEALLRSFGDTLQGRSACVIGYGKIGRSVAAQLRARHVNTKVFDRDPIRATEAIAHGFSVGTSIADSTANSGLVICATGNRSLGSAEVADLAPGAYVASVTSADDELALEEMKSDYTTLWIGEGIEEYRREDGQYFYVLNEGNAVNFLHGGTLGPSIYLVQGEILAAVNLLATGSPPAGLNEIETKERQAIAQCWMEHFREEVR